VAALFRKPTVGIGMASGLGLLKNAGHAAIRGEEPIELVWLPWFLFGRWAGVLTGTALG